MLNLVRKAVVFAMLVVASSGTAPLWLHELSAHAAHNSGQTTGISHSSCCHDATDESSESHHSSSGEINSHVDECSICFQLSQSELSGPIIFAAPNAALLFGFQLSESQLPSALTVGLQPSRGPPHC